MPKADKKEEDDDVSSVEIDDAEEAEPDEATSNDLTNPDIVTKYRTAGDIANKALAAVLAVCVPGKLCVELCNTGDDYINEAVSKIYNQKKDGKKLVEKGIAFPTCISVNNCVGHYSPLVSEDKVTLVEGDLVKIDLGVHVDGYVAVVAHTQGGSEEQRDHEGDRDDRGELQVHARRGRPLSSDEALRHRREQDDHQQDDGRTAGAREHDR